jgi:hypothetical protein
MQKVIPIMGPGCGNLELKDCPPSYHFELTEDEMMQAIKDPNAMARRLGMEEGIDSIHITTPKNMIGNADRTTLAADGGAPTMYCCIKCLSNSWCCTAWPA